jgi:hypothetical protein
MDAVRKKQCPSAAVDHERRDELHLVLVVGPPAERSRDGLEEFLAQAARPAALLKWVLPEVPALTAELVPSRPWAADLHHEIDKTLNYASR